VSLRAPRQSAAPLPLHTGCGAALVAIQSCCALFEVGEPECSQYVRGVLDALAQLDRDLAENQK
jgi:hypothetical protein